MAQKRTIDEMLGNEQKLRTPFGTIQIIRKLTPALATTLFELLAPNQRTIRRNAVEEYMRMMKDGTWRWNGDSIRIDDTRHVIDGQHRLKAVIESGITLEHVPLVIVGGADAIKSIDRGRVRNLKDLRASLGLERHNATVMSAIMAEKVDWVSVKGRYSDVERNDFYETFQFASDLEKMRKACKVKSVWCAGPVSAAIRCMRKNKRVAIGFFTAVFDGSTMVDGMRCEPAEKLFQHLVNKDRGRGGMKPVREDAWKSIRAFNAYRTGEKIGYLRYNSADTSMPEVE